MLELWSVVSQSAVLFVELGGFGVEEVGGVGAFVGFGDGDELVVGGFDGGGVAGGDAGAHEVAVALFAGAGDEDAFAG